MKRLLAVLGLAWMTMAALAVTSLPGVSHGAGTTPTPFSFTDTCGHAPGVLVESGSITVTGISEPAQISVSNGEYSINGGPYTSADSTVEFGQTVSVRHTTPPAEDSVIGTELFIGGATATFTSTTGPCLRGTN
jgi:hypothetical protein